MKGRVVVEVAALLTLTACGSAQAVSDTSTANATSTVVVTATPSPTPAPTPTPTPLPTPTSTPTPTPVPTLDLTAASDLSQVRELAASVASEQTLVRSRCADLASISETSLCSFVVNQAGGWANAIPQEVQGFVKNYNLSIDISYWLYQFQPELSSLSGDLDDELSGVQDASPSDVLSASGYVEGDAFNIANTAMALQDALG